MLLIAQSNMAVALIFAFAIFTTVMGFRSLRRLRSCNAAPMRKSVAIAPQQALAPDAYRHWEVELHDLGREVQARIDNKMAMLEMLIQQASAESERLERLLDEARQAQLLRR